MCFMKTSITSYNGFQVQVQGSMLMLCTKMTSTTFLTSPIAPLFHDQVIIGGVESAGQPWEAL